MSDLDTLKSNLETETSRLLELTNLWQGILKNERELFGEEVEGLILSAIGQYFSFSFLFLCHFLK